MEAITAPPLSKEQKRFDELNGLLVGESMSISSDEQQAYSSTAMIFHKTGIKTFRTSKKGQPEGKARVWRIS